jgi:apolipoprotein N-acyltransferase
MPIFRAIENRIAIARAANSGISYFVDKYGRISHKGPLYQRTVIVGNLSPRTELTPFNRLGPLFGKIGLLLIGLVSIILAAIWVRNRFASSLSSSH